VETGTSFQEPAIFLLTSDPKSSYKPKSILLLRGLSSGKGGYRSHAFRKTEDLIIGTFYSQTFPGSKPDALVFSIWADGPDCGMSFTSTVSSTAE